MTHGEKSPFICGPGACRNQQNRFAGNDIKEGCYFYSSDPDAEMDEKIESWLKSVGCKSRRIQGAIGYILEMDEQGNDR
ncbi:hypothetical protein, partial [Mesotoga sp. Brook.08.YT.4.2.5.4.]|uniref:hypothetical protein n=1 Tax=Mesotoga sp. Brook.08.YT.4.2.5.4. TaxID=1343998 RepID=UPI001C65C667